MLPFPPRAKTLWGVVAANRAVQIVLENLALSAPGGRRADGEMNGVVLIYLFITLRR
jgi:hypothetical protein